jgi:deoxyadenosine/deoxycytidine kinase
MPTQLVTIEGNIGTGKTTVAKHICRYMPDTRFMPAPEPESNPHWRDFQADPAAHALAMQLWFLRQRLRTYVAALEHMKRTRESVLLDFSVWSDVIFAHLHLEQGLMTAEEHAQYTAVHDEIEALGLPPPHLSILLAANSTVVLKRISHSDARAKQTNISEAYLQRVDTLYHQRWLRDLEHVYTPQRWLQSKRVPPAAAGLVSAPSLLVLTRDWNVLENVRPTAVADAVYCTECAAARRTARVHAACRGAPLTAAL